MCRYLSLPMVTEIIATLRQPYMALVICCDTVTRWAIHAHHAPFVGEVQSHSMSQCDIELAMVAKTADSQMSAIAKRTLG
jgi:hypothetical protein